MCNSIFVATEYEGHEISLDYLLRGKAFGAENPPPNISIHCCSYKNSYGVGELIGASSGEDYL